MRIETQTQQNALKAQKFGVEIEFTNIFNVEAAEAIASFLGNGYQVNAFDSTIWEINDEYYRKWIITRDGSVSSSDYRKQCELVTPILRYEDIPTLQEIVRILRHKGAISTPEKTCGVHIHISRIGHTPQTIRNLCNLMAAHQKQLIKAINVDNERLNNYCKVIDPEFLQRLNTTKPKTWEKLGQIWYGDNNIQRHTESKYDRSRYHMLNLHNLWGGNGQTIEFRLFQFDNPHDDKKGGLHAGQLKSMIQLCLAMNQLAKQSRSISPREQQTENEAYAFRCWLLQLGFIGDEFKTARDYLMRNFSGDSAWRHGNTGSRQRRDIAESITNAIAI